jgi:hypothetical protein
MENYYIIYVPGGLEYIKNHSQIGVGSIISPVFYKRRSNSKSNVFGQAESGGVVNLCRYSSKED